MAESSVTASGKAAASSLGRISADLGRHPTRMQAGCSLKIAAVWPIKSLESICPSALPNPMAFARRKPRSGSAGSSRRSDGGSRSSGRPNCRIRRWSPIHCPFLFSPLATAARLAGAKLFGRPARPGSLGAAAKMSPFPVFHGHFVSGMVLLGFGQKQFRQGPRLTLAGFHTHTHCYPKIIGSIRPNLTQIKRNIACS